MKKLTLISLALLIPALSSCDQLTSASKKFTDYKKQVYELIGLETQSPKKKKKKKTESAEGPAVQDQPTTDINAKSPDAPEVKNDATSVSDTASNSAVPTSPDKLTEGVAQPQLDAAQQNTGQTLPQSPDMAAVPANPIDGQIINPPLVLANPVDGALSAVPTLQNQQQVQLTPEPVATASQPASPDAGLPLKRVVQIGGQVRWFKSDARFLYAGFDQNLSIWDHNLAPRGVIALESKPVSVVSVAKNNDTILYIREENNILEIVKVPALGAPVFLKGFQVDGPFEGAFTRTGASTVSQDHLFVFLSDRIQVLDVSNTENIQVIAEPLVGEAQGLVMAGTHAYVIKKGALVVLDATNYTIPATVPLEGDYKLLGIKRSIDSNKIVLGKKDPALNKFVAYRSVAVNINGGGVADLGVDVPFARFYDDVMMGQTTQYLMVTEAKIPYVFDLAQSVELPLKGIAFDKMISFEFHDNRLFMIEKGALKKFDWAMESLKAPDQKNIAVNLSNEKKVTWPNSVGRFGIPSQYQMFLFTSAEDSINYYETDHFKSRLPKPYSLSQIGLPAKVRVGTLGIYIKDAATSKVYLRKWDGTILEQTALSILKTDDFDLLTFAENDLIAALSKGKSKNESIASFFESDKLGVLKKKSSFVVPSSGAIRLLNQNRFVTACGMDGLCFVDLLPADPEAKGLARGPKTQVVKFKTSMDVGAADAKSVVLAPGGKLALVYHLSANGTFISMVDLEQVNPVEAGFIALTNTSQDQFEGLSFTHGGKRLLLPSDEGLLAFDLKDIKNPARVFLWQVGKVLHVDVTNRGQSFCVSRGSDGVLCADYVSQ